MELVAPQAAWDSHDKNQTSSRNRRKRNIIWLVVWNIFDFSHHIGKFIIPTDEVIFFRGVGIPPTSNAKWRMVD